LPTKANDIQHMHKDIYTIKSIQFCFNVCLCVCFYLSHLDESYVIFCRAVSFRFHCNTSETISSWWDVPHPTDCNLHTMAIISLSNVISEFIDLYFGVCCLECVDCETQIWSLPTSGLAAAKLWFTLDWQLPSSGKCQTIVLVMKSFAL